MVYKLTDQQTVANTFLAEIRNLRIQHDRMRFRKNLERLGEVFAYEISKTFDYHEQKVETPLGVATTQLAEPRIVVVSILRAGLPMHDGLLNFFDKAESGFVSAYRRHHKDGSFEIKKDYISCPDLKDAHLIIVDPMLATGASMALVAEELISYGPPKSVHIVTAIASSEGLQHISRLFPNAYCWVGDEDEELTAKAYIVPGLGDAGDLAFGPKVQE